MIEGPEAVRLLEAAGARLFVGVPDSLMKGFCNALDTDLELASHIMAANEGGAVATAVGHYLATGRPGVVYMQNSGLGNAVNPLASLAGRNLYGVPMVLLVGWRGEPGTDDEPQHEHQGLITHRLLELLEIPVEVVGPEDDPSVLAESYSSAAASNGPLALLVRKGTFGHSSGALGRQGFSREDAIRAAISELPHETAFVATTGYIARELARLREERGETWSSDFVMVGSMGHAASVALGLASGSPDRLVCCLDGDGALAMHMGTMAVIGAEAPRNLVHLVMNNGIHESVGGQPSALRGVDAVQLALGAGYASADLSATLEEFLGQLRRVKGRPGPSLIDVRIEPGNRGQLPRPSHFRQRMRDMRDWLDSE